MTIPNEIVVFFAWLASNAGVGAVMSEFFEGEEWFDSLTAQSKNRLVMVVSTLLGLVAWFVSTHVSPDVIATWQPIATIIIGSISVYLTSQRYHDQAHKETVSTNLNLEVTTETPADTNTGTSSPGQGG